MPVNTMDIMHTFMYVCEHVQHVLRAHTVPVFGCMYAQYITHISVLIMCNGCHARKRMYTHRK